MSRHSRLAATVISASMLLAALSVAAYAQRGGHQHPTHQPHATVVRGHVFIGGYFYDPFFGPYPWWPRARYPYRYFPVYDHRAEIRVLATPKSAEVYVDGFYAGIVDDFDGVFQSLPLPPGGHEIVLYQDGFRTVRRALYLGPGSSLKLHDTLVRLPAGETSEPPVLAAPVPPPPQGSHRPPRTSPRPASPRPPPATPVPSQVAASGTLELSVQPSTAEVTIDGQRWLSSDEGYFVVDLAPGSHRVEVSLAGYRRLSTEVTITEDETTPLNASLVPEGR